MRQIQSSRPEASSAYCVFISGMVRTTIRLIAAGSTAPAAPAVQQKGARLVGGVPGDFITEPVEGDVDRARKMLFPILSLAAHINHERAFLQPFTGGFRAGLRKAFAENPKEFDPRKYLGAARKELVFYTDGDGQYDIGELPALLAQLGPHTGFVNGYKLERHDPFHRHRAGGEELHAQIRCQP